MQAIIPVAGFGTRMRPHTFTVPKVLMNVAGKPMLDHIINDLVAAGVDGVTLIVGFLGDVIEKHVRATYGHLKLNFVVQEQMLGLGHAISLAKPFHQNDEQVLIILGDTILQADFPALLAAPHTALGVREVEDPRRFGVVELDTQGLISNMIEKPQNPPTNKAIVGVYKINDPALLFECLDYLVANDVRSAKEIQLTDALVMMLRKGHKMMPFSITGWLDCGKPETLFDTNRILLALNTPTHQEALRRAYPGAHIVSPVEIGPGCTITESVIGPFAVIGANSTIHRAVIGDSILGDRVRVENTVLQGSLIGNDVSVSGSAKELNIGETSVVRV
ncbi:MAG: sugar phosphate nucleotidyltransferase [Candidatus Sumerlaeia bacterium]|nr:sugar phosphate nucleotidyltransferase [Candidatus Sumerlaeia bacterium]